MTTPADIDAIRERADERAKAKAAWNAIADGASDEAQAAWRQVELITTRLAYDVPALLAHVDALAERVRTLEAALQEIADFSVFDEHGTIEYDALDESFDRLQGIAITALGDAYIDPDADALAANADAGNGGA